MNNKMRLFVVEPDGSGGLVHYVYQLCTALAGEGVDVTLVTTTDYELSSLPHNFRVVKLLHLWKRFDEEAVQSPGSNRFFSHYRILYTKIRRAFRAVRWVLAWGNLTFFLMRSKPDLIQFSKMHFAFEAYFIDFLRRRGLILTQICHEFEEREGQGRIEALLLGVRKDVYSNFSAIFFHAEENRNRFLALYSLVPQENTHVIPHGNSSWLLNFKPLPSRIQQMKEQYRLRDLERVVLFFGLLAPSKGLDDLIDAFSIAHKLCDAKLIIAGYPTKYIDIEVFKNRIAGLGLNDCVILDTRYLPVEEIGVLMEFATVVVYPYHSSTQSGALQAAYTFGRPVIATEIGGLPEAVENGKNGFLVPVRSPKDLAEKILLLVNNPELSRKMGAHAKYLSETRFSWTSIAKQIVVIYQRLVVNDLDS